MRRDTSRPVYMITQGAEQGSRFRSVLIPGSMALQHSNPKIRPVRLATAKGTRWFRFACGLLLLPTRSGSWLPPIRVGPLAQSRSGDYRQSASPLVDRLSNLKRLRCEKYCIGVA